MIKSKKLRSTVLLWLTLLIALWPKGAVCQQSNNDEPAFNSVNYIGALWKDYQPAGGRYSVSLPGLPRGQVLTVDTVLGKMPLHMFMLVVMSKDDFVVCSVNYNDFPAVVTDPNFARKIIDSARDQLISAKPTRKLLSETDLKLDANIGREIRMEEGTLLLVARLFVVKDRMFQVLVAFEKGPKPEEVVRFQDDVRQRVFSSFRLLSE